MEAIVDRGFALDVDHQGMFYLTAPRRMHQFPAMVGEVGALTEVLREEVEVEASAGTPAIDQDLSRLGATHVIRKVTRQMNVQPLAITRRTKLLSKMVPWH
jgi:hypothetical protein